MADRDSELLTVAETARLLRRSTEQVRRYLREGALPGRRLGGQWFVHEADARSFQQRRQDGPDFSRGLAPTDPDPLGAVVAIGGSGGGDIAQGAIAYIRAVRQDGER